MIDILIDLLVVGAIVWFLRNRKKNKREHTAQEVMTNIPIGPETGLVINEAIQVINDFLNAGTVVQLFHGDTYFDGVITFYVEHRGSGEFGIVVKMPYTNDLKIDATKYPKMLANNPDLASQYHDFMDTYQKCFEPSEKAYIYHTLHVVSLSSIQAEQIRQRLRQRIVNECPLADFNGDILYNKSVYH